jgi:oxygen-independent coproporphyrinogen-3 oxidase
MILINYIGHDEAYDCGLIIDLFFDKEDYKVVDSNVGHTYKWYLENERISTDGSVLNASRLYDDNGQLLFKSERSLDVHIEDPHERRAKLKRLNKITIYEALETIKMSRSKWGTLVGIRPVKIAHEFLDKGMNIEDVVAYLRDLKVSQEKIDLVCEIAQRERPFVKVEALEDLSLYISIPFCPTRCHYCSFPSNDLKKKGKFIPAYLENVLDEVKEIVAYLKSVGRHFDCVYIGGGTPSVLSVEQLEYFLPALHELIDFSLVKEFTFEAGRPEITTLEKMNVLKANGVTRICLNPQTFNDRTLVQIGRDHTATEFCDTYYLAKEVGFDNINFDLILGLADESLEEMKQSIDHAIFLDPDNITVHTLAVKRASQIKEFNETHLVGEKNIVEEAIDYMYKEMKALGYVPYYMYRQKNMVGNLENVGFCKPSKEGLYNMRIMEERHTIVALGAGGVSKITFPSENRFERHSNPKGLDVYLDNHRHYLLKHIEALKLKYDV